MFHVISVKIFNIVMIIIVVAPKFFELLFMMSNNVH